MTVKRTVRLSEGYGRHRKRKDTFEEFLLQFSFGNLDFDRFVNLLGMAATMVGISLDSG